MVGNQIPGNQAGIAGAEFRISFTSVTATRQQIHHLARAATADFTLIGKSADQMANQTTGTLNRIANSFLAAQRRREAFVQSNLGVIQMGLQGTATSLGGILTTLGAAGVVRSGIEAAQQVNRMNALMTIFSGSTDKANQRMKQLRETADRTGQAFLDVAEGALAILPAVGRNNVDLGRTLSVVQRLAILDPMQGVEGAAFAVRELLGGDVTSLAGRFELPRQQLRRILDTAAGSPQAIIDGLNELVEGIGLTQERFEEMGRGGANAFNRLRGTVREALATGFTPFLNDWLIPTVTRLADFIRTLNRTNPQLLQSGAVLAVAAAAIRPILLLLSQYINLIRLARNNAHLAVGAGALTAGGVLGIVLAQSLVDRGIGDQRLRSDSGEDPGSVLLERIKQIIFIVGSAFIDLAVNVGKVGGQFVNGLDIFASTVRLGAANLGNAFAAIVLRFAELAEGLGAAGIADFLKGFSEGLVTSTKDLIGLQARLQVLNDPATSQAANDRVEAFRTSSKQDLMDFLFPPRPGTGH